MIHMIMLVQGKTSIDSIVALVTWFALNGFHVLPARPCRLRHTVMFGHILPEFVAVARLHGEGAS